MHVWLWTSFLQPTVHCLLVWQRKMTVRAMMRWFLWTLHRFCRAAACHRAERDKRKGAKKARKPCLESFRHRSQMLFLLYFSILCRENTLWSRQFEKLGAAPNVGLLRECMCSGRMSELGHFAIENRHNGFLLLGWNRAGCSVIFLTSAKLKVLISHSDEAYLSFCYSLFAFYICGRFLFISGWCCQLCRLQHRRKGSFI